MRRKQHQQLYLRTVVASAWNAPVSEKNESGVILSDISARRARRARFARLARALDSERDFPFFLLLPSVTPQNDSDKWKECRSFFNRGAVVKRYQLWWNALHAACDGGGPFFRAKKSAPRPTFRAVFKCGGRVRVLL